MSDTPDMSYLAAYSYANGMDPVVLAEFSVTMLLDARRNLMIREANGLPRLKGWSSLDNPTVARKIIGALLDAGWTPPSDEVLAAATEWIRTGEGEAS